MPPLIIFDVLLFTGVIVAAFLFNWMYISFLARVSPRSIESYVFVSLIMSVLGPPFVAVVELGRVVADRLQWVKFDEKPALLDVLGYVAFVVLVTWPMLALSWWKQKTLQRRAGQNPPEFRAGMRGSINEFLRHVRRK